MTFIECEICRHETDDNTAFVRGWHQFENGKAICNKCQEILKAEDREKLKSWLLSQMQKGKAAERKAEETAGEFPAILEDARTDGLTGNISLSLEDIQNLETYGRLKGMADWISIELYLSAKDELRVDLKKKERD